ncbi:hypothetical protein LCGC14_1438900, partial [marine sediment metagenome]
MALVSFSSSELLYIPTIAILILLVLTFALVLYVISLRIVFKTGQKLKRKQFEIWENLTLKYLSGEVSSKKIAKEVRIKHFNLFSEFMEKYKSDNQSLMENISISVKEENKNVLKNIVEDYEKEMDRLKESTESSILEGKDKFLNQFSDFQANITNQFDSGSKKIVKSITSFSSSVEKSLSRMKGDISSPLEILMTDYKDSIRNFELGFTEGINKFSELVSNFRSGAMEDKNLNKWISKNPEFQKTIDDTEAALMTQKNDLRNLVTTHTEKYEMDISGFLDIINRTLTGHIKAGQKSKTTQKEQVKSIIKEVNKEIDSLADAFKNEFAIQVESLSEASITISETSKNKVKSDLGFAEDSSQDDVYSKLIKNLINSYNEKIGEMQTESKETFIDKTEE